MPLTRQFRFPAFVNGHSEPQIEAFAGLLDARDPEEAIRRQAEEEAGVGIRQPRRVFKAFMSPGSVAERLTFFVAEYGMADRVAAGGGVKAEGEDIEVLEPTLDEALAIVRAGHRGRQDHHAAPARQAGRADGVSLRTHLTAWSARVGALYGRFGQ